LPGGLKYSIKLRERREIPMNDGTIGKNLREINTEQLIYKGEGATLVEERLLDAEERENFQARIERAHSNYRNLWEVLEPSEDPYRREAVLEKDVEYSFLGRGAVLFVLEIEDRKTLTPDRRTIFVSAAYFQAEGAPSAEADIINDTVERFWPEELPSDSVLRAGAGASSIGRYLLLNLPRAEETFKYVLERAADPDLNPGVAPRAEALKLLAGC
jgi:hypothetical protein